MLYVTNSFSLNMLPQWRLDIDDPVHEGCEMHTNIRIRPTGFPEAIVDAMADQHPDELEFAVGHADIARLMGKELGRHIEPKRSTILLNVNDEVLVCQYVGPRLPEGCTELPPGAKLVWVLVDLSED